MPPGTVPPHRTPGIVESFVAAPRVDTEFSVEVEFVGGLNANQRSIFELAAARWAEVIIGDLPTAVVDGRQIDDVLIRAEGRVIDGPSGTLGSAGPRFIRIPSTSPSGCSPRRAARAA